MENAKNVVELRGTLSKVIDDVLSETIDTKVAQCVVNAAGKMITSSLAQLQAEKQGSKVKFLLEK
tara:strand:+ start:1185 stop:1379 length:195 start_codon:yes stop_codon:yes gene_type:complete